MTAGRECDSRGPWCSSPVAVALRRARPAIAMIEQAQRHGARFRWETPVRGIETLGEAARVVHRRRRDRGRRRGGRGRRVDHDARGRRRRASAGARDPGERAALRAPRRRRSGGRASSTTAPGSSTGWKRPAKGIKIAEHHTGPEVDADTRNGSSTPWDRQRLCAYVEEWLPGVDPNPATETTCLYTTTPTEDFVLDRVGPVVVASPCSGHGFKFAPLIGRVIADLVDGADGARTIRVAASRSVRDVTQSGGGPDVGCRNPR